ATLALVLAHETPPPPELELPAFADPVATPGPLVMPTFVEQPSQDRLGSMVVAATWCAPRNVAIVLTAYGRVASVDLSGTVQTLAMLRRRPVTTTAAAVHCQANGNVIATDAASAAVIVGTLVKQATPAPPRVIEARSVGDETYWLGMGAVWSWDGLTPMKQVRSTCTVPLSLSPTGKRVACFDVGHIVVDDGEGHLVRGPVGTRAVWSADSSTLFTYSENVVSRWNIGKTRDGTIYVTGTDPTLVGDWLVTRQADELVMTGPSPLEPVSLGSARAQIVTAMGDRAVLVLDAEAARVIPIDRPSPPRPDNRHEAAIRLLALRDDGVVIAASQDGRIIEHAPNHAVLVNTAKLPIPPDSALVLRPDGTPEVAAPARLPR
ncbi:MAG TPA: hypothetical protein VGC41_17820, partial [Kofleriaceae bacterium]